MKKILIAADHGGFALKESLKPYLKKMGFSVCDLGAFSRKRCDYPALAYNLARQIRQGMLKKGILICKSGIGNSIVANRVPGVRAALCNNVKVARLSREHNDSNVLVLGSIFVKPPLAKKITAAWLKAEFQGGRHERRLNQIKTIERKVRGGLR
ncbi:MAG: ribose 5-phosphate isomerase B [Candidatus Omnitrophica bacterium]|nr:ribose 5-phosphate isomerase B [Candidatus Omnitrophota bacterium]MDD5027331.1 ribose 5-phosphate isomerase B [Candidatus Omnitrophota bacterium]